MRSLLCLAYLARATIVRSSAPESVLAELEAGGLMQQLQKDRAEPTCCCKPGPCGEEHAKNPHDHDEWHQWRISGQKEPEEKPETWCCRERDGSCDFWSPNGYRTPAADVPGDAGAGLCQKPACPGGSTPSRTDPSACLCDSGKGASTYQYDFATSTYSGTCFKCPPGSAETGRRDNSGQPTCACNKGFTGPTIKWGGTLWSGSCERKACPKHAHNHPDCKCAMFHSGRVTWAFDHWDGQCKPHACPAGFETMLSSHGDLHEVTPCVCPAGQKGAAIFDPRGPGKFTGKCARVECPRSANDGETAEDRDGERCLCKAGAFVPGQQIRKLAWDRTAQRFEGTCEYAPCPEFATRSNGKCGCDYGYKGELALRAQRDGGAAWAWQGQCVRDESVSTNWGDRVIDAIGDIIGTITCSGSRCGDEPKVFASTVRAANELACNVCERAFAEAADVFGAVMRNRSDWPALGMATTKRQLKFAYFGAATVLHPDKLNPQNQKEGEALFKTVNACYQNLNHGQRRGYPNDGGWSYVDCCSEYPTQYCEAPK